MLLNVFYQGQTMSRDLFTRKMLIFLYFLGRKISYDDLAIRFGISKKTSYMWTQEMCTIILTKKEQFIKMPELNEFQELSDAYRSISRLDGTIMSLDGTHVPITCPDNSTRYINRKGAASLSFLCAVDCHFRFRYIFGGC